MYRILVVDDDEVFVRVTSGHLAELGFEVRKNTTGKRVREDVERFSPVACLIDVVMEERDGLEIMTELVMAGTSTKIVAVSSNGTYLGWALGLGVDAAVLKPVPAGELQLVLDSLGLAGH